MIEKLLSLLSNFWRWLIWWVIIEEEQLGFIRNWGRHGRELTPGLHWKCPVYQIAEIEDARAYPYFLDPQSLTTMDGVSVVLQLTVTVRVIDVKAYYRNVFDGKNNIQDAAAAALGRAVREANAADVFGCSSSPGGSRWLPKSGAWKLATWNSSAACELVPTGCGRRRRRPWVRTDAHRSATPSSRKSPRGRLVGACGALGSMLMKESPGRAR